MFEKLYSDALLPKQPEHSGDACYDIYSYRECFLPPQAVTLVDTGVKVEMPSVPTLLAGLYNHTLVIHPRSGITAREHVFPLDGVIDSGYKGQLKLMMYNGRQDYYHLPAYIRCAQGMVILSLKHHLENGKMRGSNGFGSTDD